LRALAVDYGFRNIGIAIGETEFNVGSSRAPILASGSLAKDAEAIAEIARKEEVELVLMGLPVEETGVEGKMARICRALGSHIADRGFKVSFVDESFTSVEAQVNLAESGLSFARKKEKIHGEAAMLILERFWD
jgi:putative Holliday junction resolvase